MPVQGAVCPTLFGVVCSYIFLFALKGAFEELKLYGSPSLAEVQCDNSFHVSTILTLCYTKRTLWSQHILFPCKYCEIWRFQCVDFIRSFFFAVTLNSLIGTCRRFGWKLCSLFQSYYFYLLRSQRVDLMGSDFCCDPEQLDRHVPTFRMKTLQPFSG
jgi:hypothetical protein